jgi:dihydroneopterin aldolase
VGIHTHRVMRHTESHNSKTCICEPVHRPCTASASVTLFTDISLMDIVFIEDLRIDTVIGIYDWERRVRQTLSLDIEMAFDNTRPAGSDDIADTLNYKAVSKRLIDYVSESNFGLVETLAERCVAIIREEFGVSWVRLKLSKPGAVRGAKAVGVRIERGTRPD